MQLHQLKPIHKPKARKRIGRGGKKGASSGFGIKKQGASQPRIREILKRYPKIRGYREQKNTKRAFVNLEILEEKFQNGDIVNPEQLVKSRIVRRLEGKIPEVKILGQGKLSKPLIVEQCLLSASAKIKIEKAGGTIK